MEYISFIIKNYFFRDIQIHGQYNLWIGVIENVKEPPQTKNVHGAPRGHQALLWGPDLIVYLRWVSGDPKVSEGGSVKKPQKVVNFRVDPLLSKRSCV